MAKKRTMGLTIGQMLKRAREKKGLKVDDIAAACYVTRGRYYQWEAGNYIHPKNLPYLAQVFGLKLKTLQDVNGERDPSNVQPPQIAAA